MADFERDLLPALLLAQMVGPNREPSDTDIDAALDWAAKLFTNIGKRRGTKQFQAWQQFWTDPRS